MRRTIIFYIILVFSCATYLSPKQTTIFVEGYKKNLEYAVFCDKKMLGKNYTPSVFIIPQNEECVVKYFLGNKLQKVFVKKVTNEAIIGNLGSPGFIFYPIDLFTDYNKVPANKSIYLDE